MMDRICLASESEETVSQINLSGQSGSPVYMYRPLVKTYQLVRQGNTPVSGGQTCLFEPVSETVGSLQRQSNRPYLSTENGLTHDRDQSVTYGSAKHVDGSSSQLCVQLRSNTGSRRQLDGPLRTSIGDANRRGTAHALGTGAYYQPLFVRFAFI